MPETTRFAPSPTGYLHLGTAHSAFFAARAAGEEGRFLLRIEDIDPTRCRPEYAEAIVEDLAWLGLRWEKPVRVQSRHLPDYRAALSRLDGMGLLYPCFCTRAEIQAEIARSGHAPHGADGIPYPGTCRHLSLSERTRRIAAGDLYAMRIDMTAAVARAGALEWHDRARGRIDAHPERAGDVILARRETPTSYHLSVTMDDALQGITLVTRGEDLLEATDIHRLLQKLLDLPTPEYWHHGLLRDAGGRRLAKRDRSTTIRDLRAAGKTPGEVRKMASVAE